MFFIKNKSFYFVLLFYFLSSYWLLGQENIRLGIPYKVIDTPGREYIMDHSGQNIIAIKGDRSRFFLQKLDVHSLREISRTKLFHLPEKGQLHDLIKVQNQYFVLYSVIGKPGKFYALKVNFSKGTISNTPIPLHGDEELTIESYEQLQPNAPLITLSFSSNGRDLNKTSLIISYSKLGEDLKKEATETITIQNKHPVSRIKKYVLDEEGNLYLLIALAQEQMTKTGEPIDHELVKVDLATRKYKLLSSIKMEYMNFVNASMVVNKQGHISITSFHRVLDENFNNNAINGITVATYDPTTQLFQIFPHSFSLAFLSDYESIQTKKVLEESAEKGELKLNFINKGPTILNEDGSLVQFAEVLFSKTYIDPDFGPNHSSSTFYTEESIVIKVNLDGSIAWMHKLPKKHIGEAGKVGSKYQKIGDAHWLFYCDHADNKFLTRDQEPVRYEDRAGVVAAYEIDDATGRVTKHFLFSLINNSVGRRFYQLGSSRIVPVAADKIVVELYKKKKEDILIEIPLP